MFKSLRTSPGSNVLEGTHTQMTKITHNEVLDTFLKHVSISLNPETPMTKIPQVIK